VWHIERLLYHYFIAHFLKSVFLLTSIQFEFVITTDSWLLYSTLADNFHPIQYSTGGNDEGEAALHK